MESYPLKRSEGPKLPGLADFDRRLEERMGELALRYTAPDD